MKSRLSSILISTLLFFALKATSQELESKPHIGIAFFRDIIPEADMRDVQISLKLWTDELNKLMGFNYQTQSMILESIPEMIEGINNKQIHLVNMSSVDYIRIRSQIPLDAVLTVSTGSLYSNVFVLLTHRDNNIQIITDLKDKKIIFPSMNTGKLVKMWLDVMLLKSKIKSIDNYFKEIKYAGKESQLILSVFFHQSDACIVTRTAFETMKQLNPQVGEELRILEQSPGLLRTIVCIVPDIDLQVRTNIIESALKLDTYNYGKQFQTLFRFEKVVPVTDENLKNIEKIITEYNNLRGPR